MLLSYYSAKTFIPSQIHFCSKSPMSPWSNLEITKLTLYCHKIPGTMTASHIFVGQINSYTDMQYATSGLLHS